MSDILTNLEMLGKKICYPFLFVLVIGLIIRFVLLPLTFNADPYYWTIFVEMFNGNNGLYQTAGYTYTPVWGYFLSMVSVIGSFFNITDLASIVPLFIPYTGSESTFEFITTIEFNSLLKTSLIIVDVIVAFLIYYGIEEIFKDKIKATICAAIWFLCPITIMESAIHGMFDNISALFLVITLIFVYKRKYVIGGFVYAFAILTKFFPIFFIFMIIAIILKNEGFDRNGFKKIVVGSLGFIAGFVLIYLPIFATGTFWNSLTFITNRAGIDVDTLNSILPPWMLLLMLLVIVSIIAVIWLLFKDKITSKIRAFNEMNWKIRDKMMRKICVVLIALFLIVTAILMIQTLVYSDAATLGQNLAMKGVIFLALTSVVIQLYVAYRYIFTTNHDFKSTITALMLTACLIFLWPPTPQYVLVIIPILALYTISVDKNFIKPVIIFGVATMINQLATGNITMLYSLASYTPLIDENTMKSILDLFLVNYPDLISGIRMILGPIAYISILYMIYYWLKKNNWGKLNPEKETYEQ